MSVVQLFHAAKAASSNLARANTNQKNSALEQIALELENNIPHILAANALDLTSAQENGVSVGLQDRLKLDANRIGSLAAALRLVINLPDPIGQNLEGMTLPNGLKLQQIRVPFGVVGVIYEARPNVTVDIAALALKSGNAVLLRGGSAAESTNRVLVELIQAGLRTAGLPSDAVQTVDPFGREGAVEMMQARGFIDVLIPRGSAQLIQTVVTESKVPVIETGDGVVHMFIDESADLAKAIRMIVNSKVQRPSVFNAHDTLLVHESISAIALPKIAAELEAKGLTAEFLAAVQERYGFVHPTPSPAEWLQAFVATLALTETFQGYGEPADFPFADRLPPLAARPLMEDLLKRWLRDSQGRAAWDHCIAAVEADLDLSAWASSREGLSFAFPHLVQRLSEVREVMPPPSPADMQAHVVAASWTTASSPALPQRLAGGPKVTPLPWLEGCFSCAQAVLQVMAVTEQLSVHITAAPLFPKQVGCSCGDVVV
jgi:gamma-glutamyl phosphate reductase